MQREALTRFENLKKRSKDPEGYYSEIAGTGDPKINAIEMLMEMAKKSNLMSNAFVRRCLYWLSVKWGGTP